MLKTEIGNPGREKSDAEKDDRQIARKPQESKIADISVDSGSSETGTRGATKGRNRQQGGLGLIRDPMKAAITAAGNSQAHESAGQGLGGFGVEGRLEGNGGPTDGYTTRY
jgi:hypothetical protein